MLFYANKAYIYSLLSVSKPDYRPEKTTLIMKIVLDLSWPWFDLRNKNAHKTVHKNCGQISLCSTCHTDAKGPKKG